MNWHLTPVSMWCHVILYTVFNILKEPASSIYSSTLKEMLTGSFEILVHTYQTTLHLNTANGMQFSELQLVIILIYVYSKHVCTERG